MTDDGSISEIAIKSAIQKRAGYLVENLATCTMKQCRRLLEEDLDLPTKALDGHKDVVADEVDRVVRAHKKVEARMAVAAKEAKRRVSDAADARRSDSTAVKKRKVNAAHQPKASKPVKQPGSMDHVGKPDKKLQGPAEATAASSGLHKKLEKLKGICAHAGIKISPSLYKANKSDEERVAALRELLDKHGLSSKSARADCLIVKRRLEKERDLEGIDMGNVISGARRSRTANAAPVNYRAMYGEESDEDAGDEDGAAPRAAGASGSGAVHSDGDTSDGAPASGSDEGRSGDENVQPAAVSNATASSPAAGHAKKATPVPLAKARTPARPVEEADDGEDEDCASTDESESSESAGDSAGKDGTHSAAKNDGDDGGSSSDEEAPVANKQRVKRVAVLDSDDDSLDLE